MAYPTPVPQWPSRRWQCASYVSSQCSLLFHVLFGCIDQGTCVLVGHRCVPANLPLTLEIVVSLWDGYLHVLCRSCHNPFHALAHTHTHTHTKHTKHTLNTHTHTHTHTHTPIACIMSTCGGDWAGVTRCCVWPGASII